MPIVALTIDAPEGQGYTLVTLGNVPLPVLAVTVEDPVESNNLSTVVYVDGNSAAEDDNGNIESPFLLPTLAPADSGTSLLTNIDYTAAGALAVGAGLLRQVASVMPTKPTMGLDVVPLTQPTLAGAALAANAVLYAQGIAFAGGVGSAIAGSKFYADKCNLAANVAVDSFGASESLISSPLLHATVMNLDNCTLTAAVVDIEIVGTTNANKFARTRFQGPTVITFTGAPGILEVDPETWSYMARNGVEVVNGVTRLLDGSLSFELTVTAGGASPSPAQVVAFAAELGVDETWTGYANLESEEIDGIEYVLTFSEDACTLTMAYSPAYAGADGTTPIVAGDYVWHVRVTPPLLPYTTVTPV